MRTITTQFSERRCECGALLERGMRRCRKCRARSRWRRRKSRRTWNRTQASHGRAAAKEVREVTVSIPLVVILAAIAFVAWRYMGLRVWQAILCILLGFFVAATTAAPEIRQLVTAIVQWLTSAKT